MLSFLIDGEFYDKLFLMKGNLGCFLPNSVLTLLSENKEYKVFEGAVLFADVAGFTPLTEALMVLGKEGSEELTRILNNYFSEMLKIVDEYDGDVLRFAGDAITILFEEDNGETALSCALEMLEKMKDFSAINTRAGEFKLEMKIGCSKGKTLIGIINDSKEIDYYALGEPLDDSAEAEHHAKKGEIVAAKNVFVPDYLSKREFSDGFEIISGSYHKKPLKAKKQFQSSLNNFLSQYLPKHIIELSDPTTMGEHRGTTVIFLSFSLSKESDEETHKEICHFYSNLKKIVSKYGGFINKLDFGDKGSKALLLFGTPHSLEKREIMATRCALEIVESMDKNHQIKMGITSSHLFSGPLGSINRREFTVMGDGINLSARLMGYAKNIVPKEQNHNNAIIITDENTYKAAKNDIEFIERGKISVKGKSALIPIFEPIKIEEEKTEKTKTLYGFEGIQKELVEWIKSEERSPLLITSEIGGGKSSLSEWLYNQTILREYKSIKIELHPFSKELFFSLFSRIMKKLLQIKNEEDLSALAQKLPDKLRDFTDLLNPYLGYKEKENPSLKNLTPKDRRDIAFSIFLSLLNNVEKTIIIVDNLSFADETSLQFLSQYLTQYEKKSLDFAVFSRKEIFSNQIANSFEKKIELPLLSKDNIKEFLEKEFNLKNLTEKAIDFFEEKSKGNPQLLSALYETAQKENLVIEKEGVKFIDEDRLFKTTFPDSLEAIYLKEFDRLSKREKDFLFSSSILGLNVSVNLLSKISDFDEKEIDDLSDKLEKKNFLKIDNSGKRKYLQFTDTLLYEAIYNLAPFSFKRDFHKKVFWEIYNLEGESKPSVFPYLAYHSERAEDKENAIKFHRLSARMFSERYDNLSALKHYEYVIKNDDISKDYFEDSFKLLDIYLSLCNFEDFKNLLDNLAQIINKMSQCEVSSFYNFLSEKNTREGQLTEAELNLKKSLEISEKSNYLYGIARALLNLVGRVYGPAGRYEEGRKCLEKLLSLPKFEGDAVFRVVALMNLGLISRHNLDFLRAYSYYRKSFIFAKKNNLYLRLTAIISNIMQLSYESGNLERAIKYSKKGFEIAKDFNQREHLLDVAIHFALFLWSKGEISRATEILLNTNNKTLFLKKHYEKGMAKVVFAICIFERNYFLLALEGIKESLEIFEKNSCPYESFSSKLEYLRLLKFLGDEVNFKNTIKKWGGKEKILEEAKKYNLPFSLRAIVEENPFVKYDKNKAEAQNSGKLDSLNNSLPPFDPDAYFVFWFDCQEEIFLHLWKNEIKKREKFLRWDLKVKWCWAYLSKNLEPPFNPIRLLSKSPGGIFGLRIHAILYRQNLEKGNKSKADRIRKRFLDNIYVAKIHSDENIWNCILKDKDIFFAIKGRGDKKKE